MTEEEKKAIVRTRENIIDPAVNYLSDEEKKTLLNLIDKQQNQLEEKTYLYNKLETESKYLIEKQQKEIEILNEEIKKHVSLIRTYAESDVEKDKNYISKDKIRDKIKEIGSETQYLLSDKGETKQNYAIRKFYELLEEK